MQSPVFLLMVNIPEEEWSHKIDEQRKVVGRAKDAAIRVPLRFEKISRHHAELWRDTHRVWLNDLGSRGGTRVNGLCLEKDRPVAITLDDRLALSDVEFKLVSNVSKLAELIVEAKIDFSLKASENSGNTTLDTKLRHADVVRMTLGELTPAELEIMLWMYRGYTSDEELGRVLFRSPNTVRTQVASIFNKLDVRSRTNIVTWLKRADSSSRRKGKGDDKKPGHETKTW